MKIPLVFRCNGTSAGVFCDDTAVLDEAAAMINNSPNDKYSYGQMRKMVMKLMRTYDIYLDNEPTLPDVKVGSHTSNIFIFKVSEITPYIDQGVLSHISFYTFYGNGQYCYFDLGRSYTNYKFSGSTYDYN